MQQTQTAELGIIAAMAKEAQPLIHRMTDTDTETLSGITFTRGRLCGHTAVIAVCGVGKVFAALCAQTMLLRYAPQRVINTGVAGGLIDALPVGGLAIADRVAQHDLDTSALGDPVGWISGLDTVYLPCDPELVRRLSETAADMGLPMHIGVIASGDRFVSLPQDKRRLHEQFGAIACEMEGAAIGQVCAVNRVPFAVVRAISDSVGGQAEMEYTAFAEMAAAQSVNLICRTAEKL